VSIWTTDGRYNAYVQNLQGSYMRTLVHWFHPNRRFTNGARLCAEASIDGRKVGLPCVTLHP
jgi:hypothetical protein